MTNGDYIVSVEHATRFIKGDIILTGQITAL